MRHLYIALAALVLAAWGPVAEAQQTPISRYVRLTGNLNFVATGGSLRTQPNTGNPCLVGTTSSQALSGIPAGASVQAAYLYWGGSGATVDASVTLNGAAVAASRTFTATFTDSGTNYPFFGGFADVTSRVSGNATYTFGGLTVATGAPHCNVSAVAAGWSLVVIYSSPSERLRAVNVFDGLQFFRGSALTLTPDGFRVPPSNIDGRIGIVAMEGDPGNSTPLNGVAEALRFNGVTLDDGINVPGSDPVLQPFDGTINSQGVATSYGFDADTFDVSSLLAPGQTSATSVFSAGGDLVLLLAQIVSATSEPVVDLSITKTHSGDFAVGSNGVFTIRVANAAGVQREDNVVTVTDTLPAGLTFVSGTGAGWTCAAAGQLVTCTHPPVLDPGQSFPDLTLTVAVGAAAFPQVVNTAQVASASFDTNAANNSATDTVVVRRPDLSTSTKSVQDLNGGEADPGDVLRYTITLVESGGTGATAVDVTDEVPANTTGFTVVSAPPGSTNASTAAGSGANGTGRLVVTGITIPASGSVTVVFDVTVPPGTSAGALIDNTAVVTQPNGPGATPAAPQVVVSPSAIPSSGTKPLYLRNLPGRPLSRTPPPAGEAFLSMGGTAPLTWTLAPALQLPLVLPAGNIAVPLWLSRSGGGGASRTVAVTLSHSTLGTIGTVSQTISPPNSATPALFNFVIPNPVARTFPAGSTLTLTVAQTTPGGAGPQTRVHPNGATLGSRSQVQLASATVINVDAVDAFGAAFPSTSSPATFAPGATVYLRAVVGDPFGSFDIAGAAITIEDAGGTVRVDAAAMTQVADSGAATRTYEYAYPVPVGAVFGGWTARVLATEGTEGNVTDLGVGSFVVAPLLPSLTITKSSEVLTDPVSGGALPKRIPGSVVRYAITVVNSGPGAVDASALVITDPLPATLALYVAPGGGGPIEFVDGSPPSGLTLAAANVSFSNQPGGGAPYTYTPLPDADGFDAAVTGVRIAPSGALSGASGAGTPAFTVRLRARVR